MSLTTHQQEIFDECQYIINNNDRLLIKGSAGVGKTYMVNELVKLLSKMLYSVKIHGKSIVCSAPTNKAVSVIRSKVDSNIDSIEFATTHSALKLKRHINNKTGEVTFEPSFDERYPPLKKVGLLIIDEASMLNTSLLNYIEQYATQYNVKIIFIGDNKQLNPVNEENSPVFHRDYPEVELTEIVRQGKGNPIIDLSRNLDFIKGKNDKINLTFENQKQGYMYTSDKEKIINTLAAVNGTDELKYLAWDNTNVDTINYLVRQRIYGNPNKVEPGETLIFNAPYEDKYFTNQEILVNSAEYKSLDFEYMDKRRGVRIPEYQNIKLNYYDVNDEGIFVIHESSENDYKRIKNLLVKKAREGVIKWTDYYTFVEQFADMKYNHAITVHKSQGSTFKQAIVNVKSINFNKNLKEKQRLLYTAVTRASDLLILYKA